MLVRGGGGGGEGGSCWPTVLDYGGDCPVKCAEAGGGWLAGGQ